LQLFSLRGVTFLSLANNTLSGTLPNALANMTSLTSLSLSANQFYGTLPSAFGGLTRLQQLQLGRNAALNGTIPASYGSLSSLTTGGLSLVGSGVCGSLPLPLQGGQVSPQIFPLCSFVPAVAAERNAMFSLRSVWSSLASWASSDPCNGAWDGVTCDGAGHIIALRLRTDTSYYGPTNSYGDTLYSLSSTVPSALGQLSRLTALELVGLGLSGFLPSEIGQLSLLTTLALIPSNYYNTYYSVSNSPSASYCTFIYNLNAGSLNLYDNGGGLSYNGQPTLMGGLPSSWGGLTSLQTLNMSFGGCLGLPVTLTVYNSTVNYGMYTTTYVPADFQSALSSMTSLRYVDLRGNYFTGGLPTAIGLMSNLTTLLASGNRLVGALPTELGRLRALALLDLAGNALNGCACAPAGGNRSSVGRVLGGAMFRTSRHACSLGRGERGPRIRGAGTRRL